MMLAPAPATGHPAGPGGTGLRQRPDHAPEPVQSTDLLKGQKSVEIEHNGSTYRLQTTRQGKLILTK